MEREPTRGRLCHIESVSYPSEHHPERNEDAFFQDAELGVAGVFDAAGGHSGADIVSKIARDATSQVLREASPHMSLAEVEKLVKHSLETANHRILEHKKAEPKLADMATTASVVKLHNEGGKRYAVIGNVGDSRVYVQHTTGVLESLTLDDTYELYRACTKKNLFNAEKAWQMQEALDSYIDSKTTPLLPDEEHIFHRRNILWQALGSARIQPRMRVYELRPGERLLITSDGIHDNLTREQMGSFLMEADPKDPMGTVPLLVDAAQTVSRLNKRQSPRSKPDDMTAVLITPTQ